MTLIAAALKVAWNTANTAVLPEGQRFLIDKLGHLRDVPASVLMSACGVAPSVATGMLPSIIGLTPVCKENGLSRLLAMVEGRSNRTFKTWLSQQSQTWKDAVKIVAMNGFTGSKIVTAWDVSKAVIVMAPPSMWSAWLGTRWIASKDESRSHSTGFGTVSNIRPTKSALRFIPALMCPLTSNNAISIGCSSMNGKLRSRSTGASTSA